VTSVVLRRRTEMQKQRPELTLPPKTGGVSKLRAEWLPSPLLTYVHFTLSPNQPQERGASGRGAGAGDRRQGVRTALRSTWRLQAHPSALEAVKMPSLWRAESVVVKRSNVKASS
jgi:hypothetical protein